MTTPVNPDQLRISIEMGDEYQPSDRLRAALTELAGTLADEASDAEVSGYDLLQFEIQMLTYDSLATGGSVGGLIPKVGHKTGSNVFKF